VVLDVDSAATGKMTPDNKNKPVDGMKARLKEVGHFGYQGYIS
jgi:hypothetical protein